MENRTSPVCVTLASVLVIFLVGPSVVLINYSGSQVQPTVVSGSPSFLYLGYSLSTLTSAQQGSPIFTANDSLWIYSTLDQSIKLTLSDPSKSSVATTLLPLEARSIHTFSGDELPGLWTLIVTLQNSSTYTISIPLVFTSENQASAALSEYSIQNGQINLGFSVNASNSYDLEGCLTSDVGNGTLYLSEPTNVGAGQMAIDLVPGNDTAIVSAEGSIGTTFSFWFEIDYSYGYTTSIVNETVSRNLVVSRSLSSLFNSSSAQNLSLPELTSLRSGRYIIRGFFDSSSGFETTETRALLQNDGQWFWLSSCNPFSISGSTFSKQFSLAQNPKTWPTLFYFLYQTDGIESYSIVPVQINLARLDFLGEPGNVDLSDLTYAISNNSDIEATGTFAGSVFVIAKSYPLAMEVTPMIGSESLAPLNVIISQSLTDSQYYIPVGKLTVEVLNDSKPDIGALVGVTNSQGVSLSSTISSNGNTSFYLPSGFYNITISKNDLGRHGNATLSAGSNTIVIFALTTSNVPNFYLDLLLVPLALGVALNLWTWIVGPKRSRHGLK